MRTVIAVLLLVAGAGCVSTEREPLSKNYYILDVPAGTVKCEKPVYDAAVYVAVPKTAALADSRQIAARLPDGKRQNNFYHEFYASPAALVAGQLAARLRADGIFRTVVSDRPMPGIRYQLESVITELGGDFRTPGKPLAVVEVQVFLTERDNPAFEPQVVFGCRKEVELSGTASPVLVAGLNTALAQVFDALEKELIQKGK